MGIDAAIGAIDQIYQLQQQVQSPATLLASQNASPSGGASLTGAQSTSFAAQLASAQGLSSAIGSDSSTADPSSGVGSGLDTAALSSGGLASMLGSGAQGSSGMTASGLLAAAGYGSASGVAGATGTGLPTSGLPTSGLSTSLSGGITSMAGGASVGSATSPADPRITAMVDQANALIGKPYVWGGGHSGWGPQTGYDCSGFVSAVLHAGGYLSSPQDTQTLPSQPGIEAGPGQYVTIYDRTDAGGSDHVIINIGGQFYESGGEHSTWGGGGGVAKIGTPSASYLATFNQVLHPAGL